MLETLAGRLKWERTGSCVCVEIPTRKDWCAILAISGVGFWAFRGLTIVPIRFFTSDQATTSECIATLGFLVIGSLAVFWLLWSFTGKSRIVLDSSELRIVRSVLGISLDTRTFPTREVRNFRYLPYSELRIFKGFIPSVFCFEADDKTHRFGSGVTDIEAFALINELLSVYEFPKDRAVEYIGIRH